MIGYNHKTRGLSFCVPCGQEWIEDLPEETLVPVEQAEDLNDTACGNCCGDIVEIRGSQEP